MKNDHVNNLEGRCFANTVFVVIITVMALFVLRTAPRLFAMVR